MRPFYIKAHETPGSFSLGSWRRVRETFTRMFAAGQEWCFLLFCLLSAEEVWNANFTKAGERKGKDNEKEKEYVPFKLREANSQRGTEERERMYCRK